MVQGSEESMMTEDEKKALLKASKLSRNNGYLSQTTNSFQLGIIGENQWTGDENLVFKDNPFPFSIVAKTKIQSLMISKSDLLSGKIPRDLIISLE